MEKLNYRELVKRLLAQYLSYQSSEDTIEMEAVFDEKYDRYLLLHLGWRDEERIHGCPIHIDIKDGKIWIQRDFTEAGLAQELVELGVPKTDIVLAFRSPFVRQFTGFAVV
ncbi:MAG: XisI protein [Microcoleus sp. CSU_2_2]|nr:XisI protein [Microcoleus sp. SU_5_3]NJS11615.1 XisI protein [Microcoleus sp. CSU_2_2]